MESFRCLFNFTLRLTTVFLFEFNFSSQTLFASGFSYFSAIIFLLLRAGCRNARLTARLGNRELTVTARLTCGRVARSTVSKPSG